MSTKDIEATLRCAISQDKSVKEMSRDVMAMFSKHMDVAKPEYNGKPWINKPRETFLRPYQKEMRPC